MVVVVVGGSRGAAVAELAQREAGAEGQEQHHLAVFLHAEARRTIQQHMRAKCYNNSPTLVKQRNSAGSSAYSAALRVVRAAAQVGLARPAVGARAALGNVKGNHVVSDGEAAHALADALNDTAAFVAQDDGEAGDIRAFRF